MVADNVFSYTTIVIGMLLYANNFLYHYMFTKRIRLFSNVCT